MGENSAIAWTNHSFNPWIGCTKVSLGCAHCYAEQYALRYGRAVWGKGQPPRKTKTWREPRVWAKAAEASGVRQRVFCACLSDVFDAEVPPEWRSELFQLVDETASLDWLLLTKRAEHLATMRPAGGWAPQVWLGVTVEAQQEAERRVPLLLEEKASVRLLSMEPLLERVDLRRHQLAGVHWVIVGGESGKQARVFDPDWAGDVVAAARAAGVVPFVKQLGSRPRAMTLRDPHGGDMSEWPVELRVREFPEGPQRRLVGTTVRAEAVGRTGSTVEGRSPSSFVTSP